MSALTEALEQIEYWLWQNYPDIAKSLTPGLTPEEINSITENLPFKISREIQELYEWHNGSGHFSFFVSVYDSNEGLGFLSLEKAIDNSHVDEAGHISQGRNLRGFHMYPEFERWVHFLICNNSEKSPILVVTDDPYTRLGSTSLTSMALTTLECYKTGVFKINSYETYGILKKNEEYFINIVKKNNQLVPFFEDEYYRQIVDVFEDSILQLYSEGERDFTKYKIEKEKHYFRRVNLSKANFSGLNLSHSQFNESDLSNTNFSNTNLTGANLTNANLEGANLNKACLIRAQLRGANLRGVNIEGVDLSKSYKDKTIMLDGSITS